jgi:hypothetical protein
MAPRYHGAPGWTGQVRATFGHRSPYTCFYPAVCGMCYTISCTSFQENQRQPDASHLPTSKPAPSGRANPGALAGGYGAPPPYHPSPKGRSMGQPTPAGSVPAYPSGQYSTQQPIPGGVHDQQAYPGYQYHGQTGGSGAPSGSMGGFYPGAAPDGSQNGSSMAGMMNPLNMFSSAARLGVCLAEHCTTEHFRPGDFLHTSVSLL